MAHFFRAPDRRQRFLLPVDMMDWLPEDLQPGYDVLGRRAETIDGLRSSARSESIVTSSDLRHKGH